MRAKTEQDRVDTGVFEDDTGHYPKAHPRSCSSSQIYDAVQTVRGCQFDHSFCAAPSERE